MVGFFAGGRHFCIWFIKFACDGNPAAEAMEEDLRERLRLASDPLRGIERRTQVGHSGTTDNIFAPLLSPY